MDAEMRTHAPVLWICVEPRTRARDTISKETRSTTVETVRYFCVVW